MPKLTIAARLGVAALLAMPVFTQAAQLVETAGMPDENFLPKPLLF